MIAGMTETDYRDALQNGICKVVFIKDNGSPRTAIVTNRYDITGHVIDEFNDPSDLITTWDMEQEKFIRFRPSEVQSFIESDCKTMVDFDDTLQLANEKMAS
jgi:hypothetical protein